MKYSDLKVYWQSAVESYPELDGWKMVLDTQAKRRAGQCRYSRKEIGISSWLLSADEENVLDTLLHEIAHAIAGPRTGHGPAWKRACRMIGANPERCYGDELAAHAPKKQWAIVCTCCGTVVARRHARSMKLHNRYCRDCGESSLGQLTWRKAG